MLWRMVKKPENSGSMNDSHCKLYLKFENDFNDSAVGSTDADIPTNNGVTFTDTYVKHDNYAADFDGASYLSFPNHSDYRLGSTFCIEFWVRPTSLSGVRYPVSKYDSGGNNREWMIRFEDDDAQFFCSYDGANYVRLSAPSVLNVNTWQHIAVSCDAVQVRIFVGGILEAEANHSGGPYYDSEEALRIGRYSETYPYYFEGQLDGVAIHDVARWTSNFTPPASSY